MKIYYTTVTFPPVSKFFSKKKVLPLSKNTFCISTMQVSKRSRLLPNKKIKPTILKSTTQLKYSTYFSTEEVEVL